MQYDAQTPTEYLELLAEDWRKTRLLEIRQCIFDLAPELEECIQYKMLAYVDQTGSVLHLNAQASFVGVYVGNVTKVDPSGELLQGINVGKGCIRLSKTKRLDNTRIAEFLSRLFELRRQGHDLDC